MKPQAHQLPTRSPPEPNCMTVPSAHSLEAIHPESPLVAPPSLVSAHHPSQSNCLRYSQSETVVMTTSLDFRLMAARSKYVGGSKGAGMAGMAGTASWRLKSCSVEYRAVMFCALRILYVRAFASLLRFHVLLSPLLYLGSQPEHLPSHLGLRTSMNVES